MKYLIIGGVAGGATAAARLRRVDEAADIILLEKGKYISYANCGLPYYIGGVIEDRAKLLVQLLVTGIPMAVTSVLVLLAIRPALQEAVLLVVLPLLFVWLSAEFGLLMDLKRPNLVWTNEITVIKQRITVLLVMLAGWLYAAAIAALYFVVGADMGAAWYLLAWSVLTAALAVLLRRWLRRSGSRLLGRLA